MPKKIVWLFSIIDLDTGEKLPLAIFNNKKELQKGIKRYEKNINCKITNGEDYEINDFYLNNFY